jgi:hypothetical protein
MGLMRLRGCLVVLAGLVVLGLPGVAAAEEGCPNEAVRQLESAAYPEGFASGLPDCRAYEQATPVDKDGTSPSGYFNEVQASGDGNRIVFFVPANMPGASGGEHPPFFLAGRGGEGWLDRGLHPPLQPEGQSHILGWGEDLSEVVALAYEVAPGSGEGVYLRDSSTGAFRLDSPLLGLYTFADLSVAGLSSDGSRIIFEVSRQQLLPSAAAGLNNLYELHDGALSLAGVLPDGSTPPGGSFAGPYNWYPNRDTSFGGAEFNYYTQSTISSDGSRVFFTAGGTEQIYVRENGTSTVPVGTGVFVAASADGSKVLYLAGGAGGDLSEFDIESEQTTDLTPGGNVQGVLGVSADGSYMYFAANAVLASGASQANCGEATCVYVWHDGVVSFIAPLNVSEDWLPALQITTGTQKASRVASDGRFLLFTRSDGQLERYDAVNGRLSCVSCDPSGASPSGRPTLQSINPGFLEGSKTMPFLLRNLSSDGSRVFFESTDALLPRDTNGVQDVYEWEQQGVGSCLGSSETFSADSGGCLYLISSGTSPQSAYLADASANGNDVFFFTDQPLVGQDQDGLVDVYDARVGGGFASQNPPAVSAPCEGEACKPPAGASAAFAAPVSATFSGVGNPAPPAPVASKAKPKPKPKAVKKRHRKKKRKAKRAGRGVRAAGMSGKTMRGGR